MAGGAGDVTPIFNWNSADSLKPQHDFSTTGTTTEEVIRRLQPTRVRSTVKDVAVDERHEVRVGESAVPKVELRAASEGI